jgi:Arc/MetJ-type ribon-helix-helix transcriptional regulator
MKRARMCSTHTTAVDIPADLAPFVERLIAERRFLTESDVLAEGLRLLQSQESRRSSGPAGHEPSGYLESSVHGAGLSPAAHSAETNGAL